ncbi:acyl-CoA dehydrogenase family protein [Rhodococcus sp. OK302]|uniref:acyl-CoA dehydrogenase family protein n=1 Tax=Rhodococcus sp. OK302 TaxID=1882769 RepID=UPI000B944AC7|nr:acyl-CoA dehydrogenase family protein [Rhodococcus sp. OK302]OYD70359.1 acyl-CoA dehydrogenase/long-chain-acyl-CoA dehydrogenase [Rhodococcus sp. OK302]
MKRTIFDQDHDDFRSSVRAFIAKHISPNLERWDSEGLIDREAWKAAGEAGLLGIAVPSEFGGGDNPDFRFRMVQMEEFARVGANSFNAGTSVQDDLVIPYLADLGTQDQNSRWLPALCDGTAIGALALTEPGAGSDLQGIRTTATRDGVDWVLQGSKIFITNGILADVVIVLAKTAPESGARGMSLFIIPSNTPGFRRGRKLEKLGLRSNDTAELFFDDLRVPSDSLLGVEGRGFVHVMERLPRERMSIAATAVAAAMAAFEWTRGYCFERHAFGQAIGNFQATRFTLAEIATDLDAGISFLDRAALLLNDGELSAVDAAKAKYWLSDIHNKIVDRCLQLHGGYGFMLEYPIARAYADARILPIFGGTNEIMKEIIGRDIAAHAESN